jgi:hypothetical protein
MRLAPSYVHSTSVPAIWYYRNESGFLGAHMGTGVERGLMWLQLSTLAWLVLTSVSVFFEKCHNTAQGGTVGASGTRLSIACSESVQNTNRNYV